MGGIEYPKRGQHRASPEYLQLRDYVAEQPHGILLSYNKVEEDTGIKMDVKGQAKLRRAILVNKREYVLQVGIGYELAQPSTAMSVVDTGINRIENSFKRAERRINNIEDNFMPDLSTEDKASLLFKKSVVGAVQNSIENSKKLYGRTPNQLAVPQPRI
jgi:hypothetical protein